MPSPVVNQKTPPSKKHLAVMAMNMVFGPDVSVGYVADTLLGDPPGVEQSRLLRAKIKKKLIKTATMVRRKVEHGGLGSPKCQNFN